MKETRDILEQLTEHYRNIDYYQLLVEKIEEHVESNPDIAIESCKSLFEGISKFIVMNTDPSSSPEVVEKFKYARVVEKAVKILGEEDEEFELEFAERILKATSLLGNLRNDRGDISHGKLSPKAIESTPQFAHLVMQICDSFAAYLLSSFLRVPRTRALEYEDHPAFNEKLDAENPLETLSYSKALFDQDPFAYEYELTNFLEVEETEDIDG